MSNGLLIIGEKDEALESGARRAGLGVEYAPANAPAIPFTKTLIVQAGTRVPWDLLPAAWHFLERWDAAAPLWRYGVTAADVGTAEERRRTAAVVRDLRVLLHSIELLFVRDNEDGRALVAAYREELVPASAGMTGEKRLAFLRALYRVKPRLCVLPISWLAEVQARAKQDATARPAQRDRPEPGRPLVRVEITPGRWVKCHAGDEERVLGRIREQMRGRK